MLPAKPATFGRLSDVFVSSLGSITGVDNRLAFARSKRTIVMLVDGLGAHNLKAAGGHAPYLNEALAATKPIACGFPSTTATSITSFGTGLAAGAHGIVGYKVFDERTGQSVNMLNGWRAEQKPENWQRQTTVAQLATEKGVGAFVIGPPAYSESGFTKATMAGASYISARTLDDRIAAAEALLRGNRDNWVCYLYVPELDQIAHSVGVTSSKWLNELENLNSGVRRLATALSEGDNLTVTADHGVIDVPESSHVYLDEVKLDWSLIADVAGDPRVNFVYLKDRTYSDQAKKLIEAGVALSAMVLTKSQAIDAGLYGSVSDENIWRLPDLFVMAGKNVAIYQRDYAPAASLKMIGQHGALSANEMMVPLLHFRG